MWCAGLDAEVIVCDQSGLVDLFDSLHGNPTTGGTWFPELTTGSGIFNPNIDEPGLYTYTVRNRECGTLSSTVDVKFLNTPNSGISRKISICEFSDSINLFDMLAGNPDTGGTWSSNLINENGVFNPEIDISGIYTYTIDNGVCGFSRPLMEME